MSITQNVKRAKADYDMVYKAAQDAFWDAAGANKTEWVYRFSGACWNTYTFQPNFDLILSGNCTGTFYNTKINIDLVEYCERKGIQFSTANVTNPQNLFGYTDFTHLGVIDLRNCAAMYNLFGSSRKLITIDKIIFKSDGSQVPDRIFTYCESLENVTIEGVIGQNGLDVSHSKKLSKASIHSILGALAVHPTVANPTITLPKAAVDKAYETSPGANDGSTSLEWAVACEERSAWTKALA